MGKFWNILNIVRIVVELIMDAKAKKDREQVETAADTDSGQSR